MVCPTGGAGAGVWRGVVVACFQVCVCGGGGGSHFAFTSEDINNLSHALMLTEALHKHVSGGQKCVGGLGTPIR